MQSAIGETARVTRVVTCYRQWALLREWAQDDRLFAPEIEWLVVNDCPEDPCPPDLAALYEARGVRIITPTHNLGRCRARNWGTDHANTRWIEHIDGDDRPLPIAHAALDQPASVDLILFPMLQFKDGDEPPRDAARVDTPQDAESYWGFLLPNLRPIDHRLTCTLWRRATLLELHGYSERFDGNEDLHLMWRASKRGLEVARWPYPKQAYRIHARVHVKNKSEYYESLRFYQWLRQQCAPEQRRHLDLLIGRQIILAARLFAIEAWRKRREVAAFLRAKMSGEFFRLYR